MDKRNTIHLLRQKKTIYQQNKTLFRARLYKIQQRAKCYEAGSKDGFREHEDLRTY